MIPKQPAYPSADGKLAGALFDLDGVLIDSETEYTKIWSEINRRFPTGYDDLALRIKGMTLDNILATYYPDASLSNVVRDTLHELESHMTYRWLPGAEKLLKWLMADSIPRALVTSSDNKKMEHLQEEIPELMPMMSAVITADRISRSKPDPEGYLLGAHEIGIPISQCVVFEDSLQGVKAGRASGAFVVGVAGTLKPEILQPFCDIIVSSLEDLEPAKLFAAC